MAESRRPDQEQQPLNPDGSEQEPSGPGRSVPAALLDSLLRPVPLVTLGLAVVFCALLLLFLRSGAEQDPQGVQTPQAIADPSVIRSRALPEGSEVYPAGSLEAGVRVVDQALVDAMHALAMDPSGIAFLDVHREEHDGESYTFQTLHLPENISFTQLLAALKSALPEERYAITPGERGEILVSVDGVPTHRFVGVPLPYLPSTKGPKVVVVIDDMGENMTVARSLAALPVPVVFAVWPNASQAAAVRELAVRKGLDLLVHLPMEPIGYPKDNPGKQALFASMSDEALDKTIAANLAKVPEAVGVNNHMGSRFTSDAHGMDRLMRLLKKRHLFFLDSRTTAKSVGRARARAAGLPFYGRDVFLDNSLAVPDIVLQLKKAERLALRNGVAIAIGHPHPQTVQALSEWLRGLDPAVSVVPLTSLAPQ